MRHSPFTAVYDACVLYPAPLRDFLMWLGLSGRFRARWSERIHDEWKRNLLKNRPDVGREQLNRTSSLMDRAIPDGLVSGYEDLIEGLRLPDPDDRHVLAAAIRCSASIIVTFNVRIFLTQHWDRSESKRSTPASSSITCSTSTRPRWLELLNVSVHGLSIHHWISNGIWKSC